MKLNSSLVRALGAVGALALPAVVVAQTFETNRPLTAAALNGLVGRIATLENQVDTLQANAGAALSKAKLVVPVPETFVNIPPGTRATATATCPDVNDIAINCICGGDSGPGTNGSAFVDLRIFQTVNDVASRSRCDCIGENVGTVATQRIVARVTCLRP